MSRLESRRAKTKLSKKVGRSQQRAPFKRCCQISTPVPESRGCPLIPGQRVCSMVFCVGITNNSIRGRGCEGLRVCLFSISWALWFSALQSYKSPTEWLEGLWMSQQDIVNALLSMNWNQWISPSLCYRNCRICQSAAETFPKSAQSVIYFVVLRMFFRILILDLNHVCSNDCTWTVHIPARLMEESDNPPWKMGERNRHLLKPYDDKRDTTAIQTIFLIYLLFRI